MDREEEKWLSVIGKSLAVLAMHKAELGNSDLAVRAEFLETLGVPRNDVAAMLGSSANSIGVLLRRKKKGGKRRGKAKKD